MKTELACPRCSFVSHRVGQLHLCLPPEPAPAPIQVCSLPNCSLKHPPYVIHANQAQAELDRIYADINNIQVPFDYKGWRYRYELDGSQYALDRMLMMPIPDESGPVPKQRQRDYSFIVPITMVSAVTGFSAGAVTSAKVNMNHTPATGAEIASLFFLAIFIPLFVLWLKKGWKK